MGRMPDSKSELLKMDCIIDGFAPAFILILRKYNFKYHIAWQMRSFVSTNLYSMLEHKHINCILSLICSVKQNSPLNIPWSSDMKWRVWINSLTHSFSTIYIRQGLFRYAIFYKCEVKFMLNINVVIFIKFAFSVISRHWVGSAASGQWNLLTRQTWPIYWCHMMS